MRNVVGIWMLLVCANGVCSALADEPQSGWRGNRTGLWPEATEAVWEWSRIPRGALDGARQQAARPSDADSPQAAIDKGLLRDWLIIGPFPVENAVKQLDDDLLGGEATIDPAAGDKVGELSWRVLSSKSDDPMEFGTAELPWLDVAKALWTERDTNRAAQAKKNQVAYAHTWVFSPRGGPARFVADHGEGLKAWVNGREVFRSPQQKYGLGFYVSLSKQELQHVQNESSRFEAELKPGWNRLLCKVTSPSQVDNGAMRFCLRIMDPPNVAYESKNIRWMSELPGRSTSTPILVADRLFVLAEPDELLCYDKNSGKLLWSAAVNPYEALSAEASRSEPRFAERVDPLIANLRRETDRAKRLTLRAEIAKTLTEIDSKRFELPVNDHFESHFGIVGFTMPTPVSDGTHVFVWSGMGIAACFDLEGNRRWITRVEADHIVYGSSPALADGVFAAFFGKLFGFDAATGQLKWTQHRISKNVAAILAARLANADVFISQSGEIIRPRDGEILFRPRGLTTGDQGWAPPVLLGNVMYAQRYGVGEVNLFDFANCEGSAWRPEHLATLSMPPEINKGANGKWIDRWTAGSALVWEGLLYQVDIYGVLYVTDIAEKKLVYRQQLPIRGFHHYNAVPVAASPTLIGKHVFACDNQGTTIVFAPGREYREVAVNRIDTVLERQQPLPAQETLTYSPPITDGRQIFLRGERFLYCLAP